MPANLNYSFQRYLSAKKSVDDRALNAQVWSAFQAQLPPGLLRILEIGAGTGTMLERMLERGLLNWASYTGLDALPENTQVASQRLPDFASRVGFRVEPCPPDGWYFQRGDRVIEVHFTTADVLEFTRRSEQVGTWDVLVANAFLDLMDIPRVLPSFLSLLRPGGLFYFTINFDGATIFEPGLDPVLDSLVECLYHQTMDQRLIDGQPSGDSQAGRHLFQHIRQAGGQVLSAGASDWVVFAGPQGYPEDEAYFLHYIIKTVSGALEGHPELNAERFSRWIAGRHAQVERGELVYIAHQLDLLGKMPETKG